MPDAPDAPDGVLTVCRAAKEAARELATASRAVKDAALLAIADALVAATDRIVAANAEDLARGERDGINAGLLDRLRLDGARVAAIAEAVREVAALPDPVGEVVRGSTLPNGLRLRQVRVPMGVVGMIYEARPNVTVDAAVPGPEERQRRGAARRLGRGGVQRRDRRRDARGARRGAGCPPTRSPRSTRGAARASCT